MFSLCPMTVQAELGSRAWNALTSGIPRLHFLRLAVVIRELGRAPLGNAPREIGPFFR
jgi:hypothetical protein